MASKFSGNYGTKQIRLTVSELETICIGLEYLQEFYEERKDDKRVIKVIRLLSKLYKKIKEQKL